MHVNYCFVEFRSGKLHILVATDVAARGLGKLLKCFSLVTIPCSHSSLFVRHPCSGIALLLHHIWMVFIIIVVCWHVKFLREWFDRWFVGLIDLWLTGGLFEDTWWLTWQLNAVLKINWSIVWCDWLIDRMWYIGMRLICLAHMFDCLSDVVLNITLHSFSKSPEVGTKTSVTWSQDQYLG